MSIYYNKDNDIHNDDSNSCNASYDVFCNTFTDFHGWTTSKRHTRYEE